MIKVMCVNVIIGGPPSSTVTMTMTPIRCRAPWNPWTRTSTNTTMYVSYKHESVLISQTWQCIYLTNTRVYLSHKPNTTVYISHKHDCTYLTNTTVYGSHKHESVRISHTRQSTYLTNTTVYVSLLISSSAVTMWISYDKR